jgi:hypothetical protein
VLLAEADGQLYAVSNKCTHLGLPLVRWALAARSPPPQPAALALLTPTALPQQPPAQVGKTAMLQGVVKDKCIVCPA